MEATDSRTLIDLIKELREDFKSKGLWVPPSDDAALTVAEMAACRDSCPDLCRAMTPYRGCTCGHRELQEALDMFEEQLRILLPKRSNNEKT